MARSRRRAAAGGALVVAVSLLHLLATQELARHRARWADPQAEMPVRIEVAFVREMAPTSPPPPPAPPIRVKRAKATAPAARPASAPAKAASEPATPALADRHMPDPPPAEPARPGEPDDAAPVAEASVADVPPPDAPASSAPSADPTAPPAPAVAQAASGASPFEWPPSTRMSYLLRGYYRGDLEGTARVEWVRAGSRYQVHLDVSAALLFSRRMTSDGELSDEGLQPRRYDEETRVGWLEPRRLTMHFEPGRVVLAGGTRVAAPPGVQDTASQFVQLTWMFMTRPQQLRVGQAIELPLALPRRLKRIVFDVVGEERLETPVGPLDTFHLVPRADPRPGNDLTAQVWVAPALQYLPVRIRIHQDAQTYVDLGLRSLPLQAAPASSPPASR